jgi:hypothetical protein
MDPVVPLSPYSPECVEGEFSEVGAGRRPRDMMSSLRDL